MRAFLAGMVLVLAVVAAGCGSGKASPNPTTTRSSGGGEASKPASQVLADALNAADSASSLRMSGNISSKGEHIGVDLSIAKGKGAKGSVSVAGDKAELVTAGRSGYLKAGAAFWGQFAGSSLGATIAQVLHGRWLKFPLGNAQFKPIVVLSSPKALFDQLKAGADSTLKNSGETTYKGEKVVALDVGAKNGTLYVATTGLPYPVAFVKTGADGGTLTFSDWNQPVALTAPTKVFDYSRLVASAAVA